MIGRPAFTARQAPTGPSRRGASPRPAARAAWILAGALAAGSAQAQSVAFGPAAPVPAATPPAQAALAPYTSPPAFDLFVAQPRSTAPSAAFLYRHADLASIAFPWPSPLTSATCFTAGSWVGSVQGSSGDGLADLGWCLSDVGYQFSPDLSLAHLSLFNGDPVPTGLAFARLLDRTDLVLGIAERQGIEIAADPWDTHFFSDHFYRYPYSTVLPDSGDTFALQPLRLGDVARTAGLHDLAWSRVGLPDLFLLWTLVDSSTADPANWDWALLTFSGAREVRGAGAVDVDGDGIPDIVAVVVPTSGSAQLKAVHNPGTPFSLHSITTLDFTTTPDVGAALGLVAPSFAAPTDLDGVPAVAVFDAGATPPRLHVLTANPAGGLLDWSTANLAGTDVTQILAGDLVGSAAADLVAVFSNGAIQVWPGDLPPSIAWAPGSPPTAVGTLAPLVLAVDASDPDGQVASVALDIQGQPSGIAPVQSGTSYAFTIPVATLCALKSSAPSASVAVRATDDLGVWREVAASIPISDAPALQLAGAGTTLAVPLLPGGTTVTLTAQVADGCGRPVDVCWGLPAGTTCTPVQGAGTSTQTIVVPESDYPAMVAAGPIAMAMTVTVTAKAGTDQAMASVNLGFDASGLVAADHRSDRTALAPGELALLTTTLRSRVGVAFAPVVLDDRLVGLAVAGPVRVSGAQVFTQEDRPDGFSVTLNQIPGGGVPVVVELPVRLLEGAGSGSSRAQAAGSSGVPLSPAAEAVTPKAARAGLSCSSGGASPLPLLGLALYMGIVRRARARIRSTSSRIPMRRQA